MTPDELHKERNATHGDYRAQFACAQRLKDAVHDFDTGLNDVQRETLQMICTKISRILTGSANVADHWDDIAGYAALPAKQIRGVSHVDVQEIVGGLKPTPTPFMGAFENMSDAEKKELREAVAAAVEAAGDALLENPRVFYDYHTPVVGPKGHKDGAGWPGDAKLPG